MQMRLCLKVKAFPLNYGPANTQGFRCPGRTFPETGMVGIFIPGVGFVPKATLSRDFWYSRSLGVPKALFARRIKAPAPQCRGFQGHTV